jgi:hypothetical protein
LSPIVRRLDQSVIFWRVSIIVAIVRATLGRPFGGAEVAEHVVVPVERGFEPVVRGVDARGGVGDALLVARRGVGLAERLGDQLGNGAAHQVVAVVLGEPGARALGAVDREEMRLRLLLLQVLDDDGRVVERDAAVEQRRDLAARVRREQLLRLGRDARAAQRQRDLFERDALLVERDADLRGVRAQSVRVELHCFVSSGRTMVVRRAWRRSNSLGGHGGRRLPPREWARRGAVRSSGRRCGT